MIEVLLQLIREHGDDLVKRLNIHVCILLQDLGFFFGEDVVIAYQND